MSATIEHIKSKLIQAGVKNINEWGYPNANTDNIFTDEVYSAFFLTMLNDNKGAGADIDKAINELIKQIEPPK